MQKKDNFFEINGREATKKLKNYSMFPYSIL